MSTSTRILKNSGYLYLKMAFTVFVNLYSTRLILKALGASDFGIWGVVGSALGMLGFLMATLASTTSRFINFYQGKGDVVKLKKVFNNSLLLHLVLAISLCVLFEIAMPILFDHDVLNIREERIFAAKMICHFMVASTFVSIITVPFDATINAHENMLYYAITGVVESMAKLFIALYLLIFTDDKLIVYGLLTTILTVFLLVIKQVYCRLKYVECRIGLFENFDRSVLFEILGFSKWVMVSTGGILLGNYGNSIVINHYFGTSINAAQSISTQVKGQILALSNTMTKAMSPAIVKKAGCGDEQGMLRLSMTGTKLNVFLYAVLAIPFMVQAPFILRLWLVDVPMWAVCFTIFEVATALSEQFALTFHTMLVGTGNIKQINVINFLTHVIPLFVYIFIFSIGWQPYWLYIGYAFSIGILTNWADIYYSSKFCHLNIRFYIKDLLIPCLLCILLSLAIGVIITMIFKESFLTFVSSCLFSVLSYCILMFYFGYNHDERKLIYSIVKQLIKKISIGNLLKK